MQNFITLSVYTVSKKTKVSLKHPHLPPPGLEVKKKIPVFLGLRSRDCFLWGMKSIHYG